MVSTKIVISIFIILVLLGVFTALYVLPKKHNSENFDVNTDPVRAHAYTQLSSCPASAETRGNGLNVQGGGSQFTICDFVEKFKDKLIVPSTDPLDVIPRQYCALMYEKHHENFSDNWESQGVCEQDTKEKLASCKI